MIYVILCFTALNYLIERTQQKMNIAVIGLGLIGGSICKALKANTFHHIMGIDTNKEAIRKALECGAIDEEIDESRLGEANLTIVATPALLCWTSAELFL